MEFLKYRKLNDYTYQSITEEKLWLSHPDQFDDEKEVIKNYNLAFGTHVMEHITNKQFKPRDTTFYDKMGICSLTHPNNISDKMWSEYGDNEKGLILVYDFKNSECYSKKFYNLYFDENFHNHNPHEKTIILKQFNIDFISGNMFSKKIPTNINPVKYCSPEEFEDNRKFIDLYTITDHYTFLRTIGHIKQDKFTFEKEWRYVKFFDSSIKEKKGEYINKKISKIMIKGKKEDFLLKLNNDQKELFNKICIYCKENNIEIISLTF